MASKERLTKAEVQCQNLKAQLDMVKTSEARLQQEKESMHREHLSQNVLLANLHAIQVGTCRNSINLILCEKYEYLV